MDANDTNDKNDTNNKNKRLDITEAAVLTAKAAVVVLLVILAVYGLNFKMTEFISGERELEKIESEKRRIRENYDISLEFRDIRDHYDGQFKEIFEKIVNAEYIFIGTSHFTHGVTPEEFEASGRRFFNFALNGSNPSYYVWWYNDVFKPSGYIKPKAIIFGVDWFMFDTGWLWRRPEFDFTYLREVSRVPPSYLTGGEAESGAAGSPSSDAMRYTGAWYDLDGIYSYISNRVPFFSSRSRFIDLILPKKREAAEEDGQKIGGPAEYRINSEGFVLSSFYKGFVPWKADFDGKSSQRVRTDFKQEEEAALESLLAEFEADGIPVIFVMAPEYLPGRDAPQFERMTEIIGGIAKQRGIPFLNYNTELVSEINGDYTCYSDWGHLSEKGAHIFSKKLYEDLKEFIDF